MTQTCEHIGSVDTVVPRTLGCEECLRTGWMWVHHGLCRTCGHVGCCDESPGKHATLHYNTSGHPIIEGYDPPEGWGWCFIDEIIVDLPDQTPQNGPIPRFRL